MPAIAEQPIKLGIAFDRPPEAAIEYVRSKKPKASINYTEIVGRANDHSFVVAKMTQMDLLTDVQNSLAEAVANGQTFEQWRAGIEPKMREKGWWGKQEITLPDGTKQTSQLGSGHRLKTIYQTNTSQAYIKSREHIGDFDIWPYAQWYTRLDGRQRPSHGALHGQIFRRDDPYYESIKPRKAWGCRCDEVLQTAAQAGVSNQNDDVQIHEDLSDHVASMTDLETGQTVNMLKLPGKPIYKTDPGWVHAEDALPMQVLLDKAALADQVLASNTLSQVIGRESVRARFNADVKRWATSTRLGRNRGEFRHVGSFKPEQVKALAKEGVELQTPVITLRDEALSHNRRDAVPDSAKPQGWINDIAEHLGGEEYRTFLQVKTGQVLLMFPDGDRYIKLVIKTNFKRSGQDAVGARVKKAVTNSVITTGYDRVDKYLGANSGYVEIR